MFEAGSSCGSRLLNGLDVIKGSSVNWIKGEAATAASVKHKCYSLTSMIYYLKLTKKLHYEERRAKTNQT